MSNPDPNIKGGPAPHFRDPDSSVSDRHSEIFFAAVETTRMPMIVTDPRREDHPIVFVNRAFSQMTGYAPDEIIGRNCRFLQGADTDRAVVAEIRAAISESREIATEVLNYRKDGSAFWNALFISPVYDNEGALLYYFASQLDVSRRRDAEESLRQAQKMEALGQLTGGIAHDFNNLLQVIVGYADMAGMMVSSDVDPRLARAIDQIKAAADRATTLTQQLLAFSRKQRLEGRVINLNTLVANMSGILERTVGDTVTIVRRPTIDLWNVKVDTVQAEMALLNITINARDAMPAGGTLTISTENRTVHADDADGARDLAPGRYSVIRIMDTGTGMPKEIMHRVLDPFFTTREEGKGTGLGLSMVYGFMKQSGGTVHLASVVGMGTTVTLLFPATGEAMAAGRSARPGRKDVAQGTESVLVVEDRPQITDLARTMLMESGYKVETAENGRAAIDLVEDGRHFDLLFSDIVMPGGISGVRLAHEIRSRLPGIKVLLTSGYSELSLERQDAGGAEFELIPKPYRPADLAKKVREVLDGPTGVS